MDKRRITIPLKFSDGELIRNLEGLKKKFNDYKKDILRFIEGGELGRFFHGIAKDDIKNLIESMKKEGRQNTDIFREIAGIIGVEFKIYTAHTVGDEFVAQGKDLKTIFESNKELLDFPSGKWETKEKFFIKSAKRVIGSGSSLTLIAIDEMVIDTHHDNLEIRDITFKKSGEGEGLLKILNGRVVFKNVIFERIKLTAENRSDVKIENCSFYSVSTAVVRNDEAVVDIGDKTRFEKVETPIKLNFDGMEIPIKEVERIGKDCNYKFSKTNTSLSLLLAKGEITLSDCLAYSKDINLSEKITVHERINIDGESVSISGENGAVAVIETNSRQTFLITNNGSLKLKNVILEYTCNNPRHKIGDKDGLICVINGTLEMENCEIIKSWYGGIRLSKNSKANINNTVIRNGNIGISISGSSKAKIKDCKIKENDIFQILIIESEVEIENSDIIMGSSGIDSERSTLNLFKCNFSNFLTNISATKTKLKITDCKINGKKQYSIEDTEIVTGSIIGYEI